MTDPKKWLLKKNISPTIATAAGVRYDARKDALLYPRISNSGAAFGWKVRELTTGKIYAVPKGVKLSETRPFVVLDGSVTLCICEGETDALALATNIDWFDELVDPKIVCSPGANAFSNHWVSMFADYDEVYLFPDVDVAGEQLVNKVCGLIPRTRVVRLPSDDLCHCITTCIGDVVDAVSSAQPVVVKSALRRTSYKFKQSHDIPPHKLLDLVLRDTRIRRRGKEYVGKCPFHEEKSPSFMVDPKKGLYYCHGCRKGGDIISYIKEKRGISYREAYEIAASLR